MSLDRAIGAGAFFAAGSTADAAMFEGLSGFGRGELGRVALHAVAGCAGGAAAGGSCGKQAAAGAFSELAGPIIDAGGNHIAYRVAAHAVAGGLGSMAAGGKFENGAVTGAFGYLFNSALHDWQAKTTRVEIQGNIAAATDKCALGYCLGVGWAFSPDALHLSVTIYDTYSGIQTIDGQPRGCAISVVCLNYVPIDGQKQQRAAWDPFTLDPPASMGNNTFAQSLRKAAAGWPNDSVPYRSQSTSNSFVREVLSSVYGTRQDLSFRPFQAPGY